YGALRLQWTRRRSPRVPCFKAPSKSRQLPPSHRWNQKTFAANHVLLGASLRPVVALCANNGRKSKAVKDAQQKESIKTFEAASLENANGMGWFLTRANLWPTSSTNSLLTHPGRPTL